MSDAIHKAARRTLKFATVRIYLQNGNTMRYTYEPGHLFDLCRTQLRIRDDKLPDVDRLRLLGAMQRAVIAHKLATIDEVNDVNQRFLGITP